MGILKMETRQQKLLHFYICSVVSKKNLQIELQRPFIYMLLYQTRSSSQSVTVLMYWKYTKLLSTDQRQKNSQQIEKVCGTVVQFDNNYKVRIGFSNCLIEGCVEMTNTCSDIDFKIIVKRAGYKFILIRNILLKIIY